MTTESTYRHPRTGTAWIFPHDARRYAALRERTGDGYPCENQHHGCAVWEHGPCSDQHRPVDTDPDGDGLTIHKPQADAPLTPYAGAPLDDARPGYDADGEPTCVSDDCDEPRELGTDLCEDCRNDDLQGTASRVSRADLAEYEAAILRTIDDHAHAPVDFNCGRAHCLDCNTTQLDSATQPETTMTNQPTTPIIGTCPGCNHPVIDVQPYTESAPDRGVGVVTIKPDGSHCCSEWEGEFETAEIAEIQCVITRDWIATQAEEAAEAAEAGEDAPEQDWGEGTGIDVGLVGDTPQITLGAGVPAIMWRQSTDSYHRVIVIEPHEHASGFPWWRVVEAGERIGTVPERLLRVDVTRRQGYAFAITTVCTRRAELGRQGSFDDDPQVYRHLVGAGELQDARDLVETMKAVLV